MSIFKTTAAAAALLLAVPALAAVTASPEPATAEASVERADRSAKRQARMTEKLGLTEAQATEIAAIKAQFRCTDPGPHLGAL